MPLLTKTIEREDNSRCRFEIWDTTIKRYHSLPMYYRGTSVSSYDITSTQSFEKQSWVNELQQSVPLYVISLVGWGLEC